MGTHHNPKCSVKSECCSVAMSAYPDLCHWHFNRIGSRHTVTCDCGKEFVAVSGDSVGRCLARDYFKMDWAKTPVFCIGGDLYCCGECSNTDSQQYRCGKMLVGPCCKDFHTDLQMLDN